MPFTQDQIVAVREAFHLAGFDGELRTLPVESDHERIFIVPLQNQAAMGDEYSLELVLTQVLNRTVSVTGDVGAPTVPFP